MRRVLAVFLAFAVLAPGGAGADGLVALGGGITELRQAGDVLWAKSGSGPWARVQVGRGLTVEQSTDLRPPPLPPLPPDAMADSRVGVGGARVRRAWLADPTLRYTHGVLGNKVEAGALVVQTRDGIRHRLRLEADAVFEDLAPRVVDLDGDGVEEVVVVKSYLDRGAAVAVAYFARDGTLTLAESPPLGRANRWLNPVGAADLDGDGVKEIAVVETPHIGGTLRVYAWTGEGLVSRAALKGFCNHVIGSRVLDLSAIADVTGDGRPDLVVPSADRRAVKIVRWDGGGDGGSLRVAETLSLPGEASRGLFVLSGQVVVGLEDGRLALLSR